MELLAREALISTGPVDHADWNFKPILGRIQKKRFHMILDLMERRTLGSLLEIGYGSGVFLPELARRSATLAGVDIHDKAGEVAELLAGRGVRADLRKASVTAMPFPDRAFDAAVSVSALEFVEDLGAACKEIGRVLKPGGELFVVTPERSRAADLGLWVLTRKKAREDFADRRERLAPTLLRQFRLEDEKRASLLGIGLYRAFRLSTPLPA